ncbi:MAG: hypothetical protein PHF86_09640 [Candidatus Nanoarchaeia archaeon]|nr:hypothetical protein [Candidatus Nanoarchaeia archaeon]
MATYTTNSKSYDTKSYPVETYESTNLLGRTEPIITPDNLINGYLKGINLSDFTEDDLKRQIELAINEFELMTNLSIYKRQVKERLPFDRSLYKQFVFVKVNNRPILSVDDMTVISSNGDRIFQLPPTWIEAGFFHKGQINVLPILAIMGSLGLNDSQPTPTNAGLIFLQCVNNYAWLPAFFTVLYTTGISKTEGQVPIIVNDILSMNSAIRILSQKQAQFKHNSTSISQDGISQSAQSPGVQTYVTRIQDLTIKRDEELKKIRAKFSSHYFLSNI